MSNTINFTGTGGIIEGNLGAANVNVNLDSSLNFDGTDDVLTIADAASLDQTGDFTIAVWVRPDTFDSNDRIIARGSTGNGDFMISAGGSRVVRVFCKDVNGNTKDTASTFSAIPLDAWSHLTVVFDRSNNKIQLSINGAAFEEFTGGDTWNGNICNGSNPLRIGFNGSSNYFDGRIADVRFYNTALTIDNAKILASKILSNENLGAGTTNLIGWWKLNNNSITDSSTNSNNASATGTNEVYDDYSVDVYDNSTTTDGTFTVTQGKVEGKALSSVALDGTNDTVNLASSFTMSHDGSSVAVWVKRDNATGNEDVIMGQFSDANQHWFKIGTAGNIILRDYPTDLACGNVITDTNWHHIVATLSGDSNGAIYVDGVAQTLTSNAIVTDPTFDQIGRRGSGTDPFDGKIRDLKVFDYALSAEQAASLYSNTYPQTALSNWKFDEGTGNATNSGTSSANNGTLSNGAAFSNGTLDLDYDLVIAANGTLSAPRGTVSLVRNFQNSGTFTHNNGTFEASQGDNTFINTTATVDPVFYNVTHIGDQIRFYENTTIENSFVTASSAKVYIWTNKTLTMGTTTSAATLTVNVPEFIFYAYNSGHTAKLAGASSLYPIVITGSDNFTFGLNSGGQGIAQVENVDFQLDISTQANEYLQLTGDAEFDAVTVTNGTFDLNGQRAVIDGVFDIDGSIDADGMLILNNKIDYDGQGFSNPQNCTMIFRNTTGGTIFNDMAGVTNTKMIAFLHGSTSNDVVKGLNQYLLNGNVICGGRIDLDGTSQTDIIDLTIPTGGKLNPAAATLTCSGDFTTSGGLLGASCLSLDRDNTEYAQIPYHSDLNFFNSRNAMTAECWFKTSYTGSNHQHLINLKDVDGNPQVMQVFIDYSTGKINARIFTSGITSTQIGASDVRDGKWHHVAIVYDGDTTKHSLYIDGKLEAEETGSGAVYAATDAEFNIGVRFSLDQGYVEGEIDEVRLFAAAKTAAQIREDMFKDVGTSLTHFNSAADASTDGLVGRWGANEGTGSALSCSNSNLNGVIFDYNGGSPAAYTDAWAGTGTFNRGTSTVNMTGGSGKLQLGSAGYEFNNLGVAPSGGTTTLSKVGGHSNVRVYGTLTHNSGTFAQSGNMSIEILGSGTVSAGATLPYIVYWGSSTNVPTANFEFFIANENTVTFAGACDFAGYLRTGNKTIVAGAFNHSLRTLVIDNGGTADLRNTTLTFTGTTSSTSFDESSFNSTILSGNTNLIGHISGSNKTHWKSLAGLNHEIVGNVSNLDFQAGNDLTIVGSVTNCTGEGFRQFHHTLDTQQLLDADEAGDDDLRLTKPALDNALELMTK